MTLDPLPGQSGRNEDEINIGRLNNYFLPKANMTYERHIFRSIRQEQSETFDQFLTRLRSQVKKCGFSNLNENVKDLIVDGCKDPNFRRKVLERGDIATLDDVVKLAQTLEVIFLQVRVIRTLKLTVFRIKLSNTKQAWRQKRSQQKPFLQNLHQHVTGVTKLVIF